MSGKSSKRSGEKKTREKKVSRVGDKWGVIEVSPPDPKAALGDPLVFDEDGTPEYLFLVRIIEHDDVPDIWKAKTADLPPLLRALARGALAGNFLDDSLDGDGALRRWLNVGFGLEEPDPDGDGHLPLQDGRVINITGAYKTIPIEVHHTFEMNGWVIMTRGD